jgi:rod shape-determining protein MreC
MSISVGLMIIDHRSENLSYFRSAVALAVKPLHELSALPARFGAWLDLASRSHMDVREQYDRLRGDHVVLKSRLQKFEAVEAENRRLNRLLSASRKVGEEVLLAQLVEVSLDPFTHKVLINRGVRDGVYSGQPVIDPDGVIGQITHATLFTSSVTLLTDQSHAIPAQIRRNGLRVVVYGLGVRDRLSIPYLAQDADIRDGDILITSGMGGRFPSGYPVAQVTEIVKDPNEPFLGVTGMPVARLDYTRDVLLVWQVEPGDIDSAQAESDATNGQADAAAGTATQGANEGG